MGSSNILNLLEQTTDFLFCCSFTFVIFSFLAQHHINQAECMTTCINRYKTIYFIKSSRFYRSQIFQFYKIGQGYSKLIIISPVSKGFKMFKFFKIIHSDTLSWLQWDIHGKAIRHKKSLINYTCIPHSYDSFSLTSLYG